MPEHLQLRPHLTICRILNGMWQMSGAHGEVEPDAAVQAMFDYHDAGFTTWDLADHYGPAEDLVGEFRNRLRQQRGEAALAAVQAFTKWVPQPGSVSREQVRRAVQVSLRRMQTERLDMLQFHWWDYEDDAYLDALSYLDELRQEGLIAHLSLTNFDTTHLRIIVERGIPIASNQVQYSLIDRRPEVAMAGFCAEHDIYLLTYGTVAGGLLSERYLGKPEPGRFQLDTASLRKYKQMIDAWGGWDLFQELLQVLHTVAERKQTAISTIALRYILDRPAVGGVIVGARLGLSEHIQENAAAEQIQLEAADVAQIDAVLERGADLFRLIGDCGDEYRR